jgi:integrase/recombinase XerD
MLLRETGLRRGELLGLHLVDVDVTGRLRVVRRDNPNGAWVKGAERIVPILHRRTRDAAFVPAGGVSA